MPRAKQESKRLNVYIEASVVESFCDYCQERGLTKSAAERIIRDYLYRYFKEKKDISNLEID